MPNYNLLKTISDNRFTDMIVNRFDRYVVDLVFRTADDTEFYLVSSACTYT